MSEEINQVVERALISAFESQVQRLWLTFLTKMGKDKAEREDDFRRTFHYARQALEDTLRLSKSP